MALPLIPAAPFNVSNLPRIGRRLAAFGDSKVALGWITPSPQPAGAQYAVMQQANVGFLNWTNRLLGQYFTPLQNFGVSGYDTSQLLANTFPNLVAAVSTYDTVWIDVGVNDVRHNLTDKFSLTLNAANLDLPFYSKTYPFLDGSLNAGRFVDFVVGVTFATDNTGAVNVWRRNEGAAGFQQVLSVSGVQTLSTKPSVSTTKAHYWKQGLYRSPSPNVTNVHYMTGLVRAPDFATAVTAAFGG